MLQMIRHSYRAQILAGSALLLMLSAGAAQAQETDKTQGTEVTAIVVSAPKGKAADIAPVKSSLLATEPEALITRKEIEEVAPRVGDYTTTAVLAPSMASTPNPNGPGSTDGAKLSLRGFADGTFNVTYDGIAWGDANGPSHHANSFFPSSTIGAVIIDRGPGAATDLGQANFGGQVNLYSLPFEDKFGMRQTATTASFNTWQSVTTVASGPIKDLHDLNLVVNYMQYGTNGYLTNSPSNGKNVFAKATLPVTDKLTLTGLYTWNYDFYNQGDSNSTASVAQTSVYGKRFALSNDPTQQTFSGYNYTNKKTDFAYFVVDYDFGGGLKFKNTDYTYAYSNYTYAANDATADQSLTIVTGDGGAALKAADMISPVSGSKTTVYGLPGYLKRNQYRVVGDIARFDKDFGVGTATVGGMYEFTNTERSKFDINLLTNQPDYREKQSSSLPVGTTCAAQGLATTAKGPCANPLNVNNNEYSGWHQYQIFAQFEWRPIEALKVTPGVKYVNFDLFVHAPSDATVLQPVFISQDYTKTLPFLTANYRIASNWSVYAEYAQGFLVPNVSAFNVNNPGNGIIPQQSTNYQLGTVFSAGKLSVDADIYHIDFLHKLQTQTVTDPTSPQFNEQIETNNGNAVFDGVEGQATYVLPKGFSVFGNYSRNNAVAKDDHVLPLNDGQQIPGAARWTAAAGVRSEWHDVGLQGSRLVMNVTDKWIGPQTVNGATATLGPAGTIKTFSDINFSGTYSWKNYSLEGQVLNLANSTGITGVKGKTYIPGTTTLAQTPTVNGAANLNQFVYDIGTTYQVTVKVAF
jgi:iron complex outermembrane receptor protein